MMKIIKTSNFFLIKVVKNIVNDYLYIINYRLIIINYKKYFIFKYDIFKISLIS